VICDGQAIGNDRLVVKSACAVMVDTVRTVMASQPTEALASLFDTTEDGLDDTLVNMELPDMIAKILGFSMTAGKMH